LLVCWATGYSRTLRQADVTVVQLHVTGSTCCLTVQRHRKALVRQPWRA